MVWNEVRQYAGTSLSLWVSGSHCVECIDRWRLPLLLQEKTILVNESALEAHSRALSYLVICVDGMGTLLQPDHVSQRFQQLLAQYGLRQIRFHDLRHSCATIMLYLGYNLKDIQTWLGHSNYHFTADTYVHSAPAAHVKMADFFSEMLRELLLGTSIEEDKR